MSSAAVSRVWLWQQWVSAMNSLGFLALASSLAANFNMISVAVRF